MKNKNLSLGLGLGLAALAYWCWMQRSKKQATMISVEPTRFDTGGGAYLA
jgi:hypothetical protein